MPLRPSSSTSLLPARTPAPPPRSHSSSNLLHSPFETLRLRVCVSAPAAPRGATTTVQKPFSPASSSRHVKTLALLRTLDRLADHRLSTPAHVESSVHGLIRSTMKREDAAPNEDITAPSKHVPPDKDVTTLLSSGGLVRCRSLERIATRKSAPFGTARWEQPRSRPPAGPPRSARRANVTREVVVAPPFDGVAVLRRQQQTDPYRRYRGGAAADAAPLMPPWMLAASHSSSGG